MPSSSRRASGHALILAAVLACLCVTIRCARLPNDGLTTSGTTSTTADTHTPLAPWLHGVDPGQEVPECVLLRGGKWGIGSTFNQILWTAAILKQLRPDISIYYNHGFSSYQCANGASKSYLDFFQPGGRIIQTGPPPEGCVKWKFFKYVELTHSFLNSTLGGMISENKHQDQAPVSSLQLGLQRHLLMDAMFQAMCPMVRDWWHLAPEVQARADAMKQQLQSRQRPVIAIHARGGDKATELGKYVDPVTKQYPMAEGMQRLVNTHPAIRGSSPNCVIFSDDYKYAQSVKSMAENILKCGQVTMRVPEQEGASHETGMFKTLDRDTRCESTKEYLTGIEIMGWANFFVANHRANADTIAALLRKCKFSYDFSTTVPGTGAPRFTFWAR